MQNKKKKLLIGIFVLFILPIITCYSLYLLLPNEIIEDYVYEAIDSQDLVGVTLSTVQKTLLPGIEVEDVLFYDNKTDERFIVLDSIKATLLNPVGILTGSSFMKVVFAAETGEIDNFISFAKDKKEVTVETKINNFPLSSFLYLNDTGYPVNGLLKGNGMISVNIEKNKCPNGNYEVSSNGLDIRGIDSSMVKKFLGETIDLNAKILLKDCKVFIEGLWIDGKWYKSKVEGEIDYKGKDDPTLNLQVELTKGETFEDMNFLLSLLSKFQKSSGYYKFRILGTLQNPKVI